MNKINYILLLCLSFALSFEGLSQDILIGGATTTACSGTFLDSGGSGAGANANYGASENITWTLCPSTPGTQLMLDFTSFDVEDGWDFLTIYNGSTNTAPSFGTYSGPQVPGIVLANNASGCLTFEFTSDGTGELSGWEATISCSSPCQASVPGITSVPALVAGTYIDVCPGDNIQFMGSATFPNNNNSYFQSEATSTFDWEFSDGGVATGQVVNYSFNTPGIYQVDLEVTDVNGCMSTDDIDILVRVAADPIFDGTIATTPVICLGQTNTLTGFVAPTEIQLDCTPPVADLTFLPDGSGVSYQTSITVDCFAPGQTLTAANQLQDICLDIEHSYLGDLELTIECPNGQQVVMHSYGAGGGGTYLGDPIDDVTSGAGAGFTYCFDESATDLLVNGGTVPSGTPAGNAIAAGSYLPENSFAGLVNCPMNGDWSIIITDNIGSDDGYIFGWSMNFDPAILPGVESDIPAITAEGWQADPTITATAGNVITVEPTVPGQACYTYEATNEYGCTYDTTVCFTVLDPSDPACPSCLMTNLSASIGACETGDVFTVTGDFDYTDNPGTGTVIVEVTNGSGTYTQVFNPPFVDGQLYNFSVGGVPSDGTALTVTVYFSDDPTCTLSINSTSPASCACTAEIGTFTTTSDGTVAGTDVTLCFGDALTVTSNGDGVDPLEANNPPGPTYDPGISWLIYSCPPSVALTPDPVMNVTDDPCILGVASNTDLNELNDMFWINAYPPGTFTDNTVYFIPITMYSLVDGTYSYVNTSLPCYEMGPAFAVQYLPEVTETSVEDCTAGTVTTTINGGQPAVDGTQFTGANLLPATANFVTGSAADGGTIVVGGLVDGDVYSYDILDGSGCSITVTGTFVGLEDPSFTYPSAAYCEDEANPSPLITGVTGGTFSSTAGLSINAASGQINLLASTPGTYTVTYQTPDAICFDQTTFDITINPLPIVDGNDETICFGDMVTLNGTGADTYTWDNGVTDGQAFAGPATTTVYTVTGTITATGCENTGTVTVTVTPLDDPSFTTTDYCVGTASPAATVTGLAGGTFAFNPLPGDGATINAATGAIINGVGGTTYTVEYTTNGPCPQSSTQTVTVNALPIVIADDESICIGGTASITASGATTYSWDQGLGGGQTHNVSPVVTTNYTVTGTDANGCVNVDVMTVTVLPNAPIDAGLDVTICFGDNTTLSASGGATYTWDQGLGAGQTHSVSPATTTTYTVDGVDAQGCTGTDQVTVTINPLPTATIAGDTELCVGDADPTITFTGGNGTAPYTFTYSLNGGADQTIVSTGTTATMTAPTGVDGTFVYTLISVEDASGTNCSQLQAGTATVIVNPLPTATITGTTDVCVGDASPVITFTGADGTAPYTFTYTLNGGANQTIVSTGNTATINVPTGVDGTFAYSLVSVSDASATACSQVQTGTATVIVNPLPTATIVGDVNLCINAASPNITFTGADGTAPYTFTYTLNGGANQTIVSTGNTATIAAPTGVAGTFVYELVSVEDASSTACSQLQAGTATVVINPAPTATIAGTIDVCVGAVAPTITFTGADGTAPYTFTYNINGGANQTITSVGTTATVTAPTGVAGTFTYNLVSVQDGSVTACVTALTEVATVIVNPLPTATITGTTSVCEGDTDPVITFTGADGTAPYTFTYNINGGANQTIVSTGNTATITVPSTPVGVVNYNLVSVEDASSTSCSQAQTGTATITINANPTPVINGAATYCTGTFSTLSTSVPFTTYAWSTGANTPTVNVTDADNPITVTVTNAFGCSGTSPVFVVMENSVITYNTQVEICQGDIAVIHGNNETVGGVYSETFVLGTGCDSTSNVTLIVNPLPVIDAGLDQMLCDGVDVTLNATGAPTIVWDVATVNNGAPFTQGVGTVTYTATGTDVNGCVNTDQVDVTINPLPTATIAGTVTVCQGDADPTITFTGANGTAPYTFSYTINGGGVQTVTSVGNVATVTAPTGVVGTFDYSLVSVEDASSTACSQAQTGNAIVTVNPLPTATIAGSIDLCLGAAAPTITFTGANGTAPYTFSYTINGGANQTVTSTGNTATVTAPTGVVGTFDYDLVSVVDASATACSQAQTGTATVVINPLPTATITGDMNVCLGAASPVITFTGANGTAPYTFSYTLNNGAVQTIVSVGNTATINVPTGVAGTFAYDLVSVEDASSTACSQAQTGTATVVVNPLPTATIAGTIAVCVGDTDPTITFTGADGTAPYTFSYTINGGAVQTVTSVGNTATVTAPTGVDGTFDYELVSVEDASTTTCSQAQTGNAIVTVNPLPTATIAGTIAVCVGATDPTITFTGADGTAPYTFSYTINGGAVQTVTSVGNTATVTAPTTAAGTFDYELVSVVDASSTACSQAQTGNAIVTVNPSPTATIAGDVSLCLGAVDPTITFTGADGTAPYTFSYTINGGAIQTIVSNGNTATITVSTATAGTFDYELVSVSDASITACSQAQIGVATVTINALPVVFAGNDFTICEGDQAVLTGSGALIYVWDNGISDGSAFTPSNTEDYIVTGTDANGCVGTDDVTITVEPLPVVSFIGDNLMGCSPLTVTFTNTTAGTLTDCIWTLETGAVLNGCTDVTYTFENPGLFDVTLTTTSSNGCTSSATYTDYIYVEADPVASFEPSATSVNNFNTEISFDNTSTGAVNYQWDFGDLSGTETTFSPVHVFPDDESGTYEVQLIAYSPLECTDTAYVTVDVTEEVIYYVPNTFTPDGDAYNEVFQPVFTSGYDPYDFTLLIFNRWGEIVFESHDASIGWNGTYGGSLVQDGTFTWKIEFKTTANDERKVVHGHVNILR